MGVLSLIVPLMFGPVPLTLSVEVPKISGRSHLLYFWRPGSVVSIENSMSLKKVLVFASSKVVVESYEVVRGFGSADWSEFAWNCQILCSF